MAKKYPQTKAALLRLVKELERNLEKADHMVGIAKEQVRDMRGDVQSARKRLLAVTSQLNEMRVAYAELRGYTHSMIDAEEPCYEEPAGVAIEFGVHQQTVHSTLPPNFPAEPHAMYDRDDQTGRLPF